MSGAGERYEVRRHSAVGPFVLVCDHASYAVPPHFHELGLSIQQLTTHIGWDIGAAAVAEILSERFDSTLILCGTSRLVIDCNRQLSAPDLIPETSHGIPIPGNVGLSAPQRQDRIDQFFSPYHDAIERVLEGRSKAIFLSVHSMTQQLGGEVRGWPISLSSYRDRTLVEPLLSALREGSKFPVGDNEPYALEPEVDYSTPFHALRRGLRHIQVEFRQDQIADGDGQQIWAGIFGDAMEKAGFLTPAFRT